MVRFAFETLELRRLMASDWQNAVNPRDVNSSGLVTPLDALVIINEINSKQIGLLPTRPAQSTEPLFDVNGDGWLTPLDVLVVVNALNQYSAPLQVVAGLSPESDPNGNGVVLIPRVQFTGQTLPEVTVFVATLPVTSPVLATTVSDAQGRFQLPFALPGRSNDLRISVVDPLGRTAQWETSVRQGDVVLDWNAAALNIIREWSTTSNDPYENRIVPSQPPQVARNLAMIHAAMFDAVNSIDRLYEPYLVQLDAAPNTSSSIAAAAAAHHVASRLYAEADEKMVWDASLAEALAVAPTGIDVSSSLALGRRVGDAVLAARANDGAASTVPYATGTQPGDWNRTAPGFLPPMLTQWPMVKPFALVSGNQFRPAPPPTIDSDAYTQAVDQVMRLGAFNSTERTAEQTEIATFWADGGGTFTPPGHWNQIASDVALARNASLSDNAHTFALLNIALADAGIVSWDAKYTYDLWRPIDAIRKADTDGNANTLANTTWLPLIITPPFSAYTSGHSTFSGAAAAVLTSIFGDNVSFTSQLDGQSAASQRPLDPSLIVTRSFSSFEQAAEEAGMSRIYGGIHFNFDNLAGHETGALVGTWVVDRLLRRRS